MAFGKRKRQEEEQQISCQAQDIQNSEIQNLDDESEEEESNEKTKNTGFQSSVSRNNDGGGGQVMHVDSKSKPLYQEVTIHGATLGKNPGGSKNWSCNYCKKSFTGSYTRIHYHFFGAPPGKKAEIKRCPILINDRDAYERVRRRVQEVEKANGISSSLKNSRLTSKSTQKLEDSFNLMERDMVDLKVIRGLCANGIPFNVLRNPHFHEMVSAINRGPKGYKAPSYDKARTTLLDECKRSIEKDLVPVKDTWYSQGVSIVSDGWTNCKNQPLINILAVNSRGSMFLYAEDFSGIEKTGVVIAEYLLKAIEEVGPHNVLQVVTDNAANCKVAGQEVQKVHKHIFWSPCVVHTLNLIFKDFARQFEWLSITYKRGKNIVKYFLNHSRALAMFREYSKLELLKVAKTRFASHYILLKRLIDCREALATTVVIKSWKDLVKQGDEHAKKMGALVAETIISEEFWEEVENIVTITKPIYLLIKFCDGEGLKMGEIYEKMDNMLGEIKDIMKENKHGDDYEKMEEIVLGRWEKMSIPLHCLGFALTPRFYDSRYLALPAPGGTIRRPPNEDKEVIMGVMEAFNRIADDRVENGTEARMLHEQFAIFHSRKGLYAMAAAQTDAVTMDAIDWWSTYGSETPELAKVARKVLSQPITSSSVEWSWSTYSYIHNVKRNRLNATRANKLVFIHSNIRILPRFIDNYKVLTINETLIQKRLTLMILQSSCKK